MRRLQLTFHIVQTEDEARAFCAAMDARASRYCRQRYPAHYTPYSSTSKAVQSGTFDSFICWYHI